MFCLLLVFFFFFKQKTAYEMRISDWSSDVCSSDLLFQLRWMLQMWRNCTVGRYATNKERMLRISSYSRDCLHELVQDTGIQYDGRRQGTLQLFRTERQMEDAHKEIGRAHV